MSVESKTKLVVICDLLKNYCIVRQRGLLPAAPGIWGC